jgi:hypothetical protein
MVEGLASLCKTLDSIFSVARLKKKSEKEEQMKRYSSFFGGTGV